MSYEKQNGVPKRRPLPTIGTQSPKVVEGGGVLSNGARSPISDGHYTGRGKSQYGGGAVGNSHLEETVATPVKTFLSSNITPRSSSRKARIETASPTPNSTPTGAYSASRPVSSNGEHERNIGDLLATNGLGLRMSDSGRRSRARSLASDGPGSSVSSKAQVLKSKDPATRVSSPENVPKFFHADDVRPTVPSQPTVEQSSQQDGLPEDVPQKAKIIHYSKTFYCNTNSPPDEQKARFSYANSPHDLKSAPTKLANGTSPNRPQLQTIYSANAASSPPRASSPLKDEMISRRSSLSKPSPRRHTRLVSNPGGNLQSTEVVPVGTTDLSRRSSLNSPKQPRYNTHIRSPSVPTTGSGPARKPSITLSDTSPVKRVRTTSITGALPHSVNPPSVTNELPAGQVPLQLPSPTKATAAGQSRIDQMNELAANARRERKVLDLEISNSSLLAINRTLEREMRKQNAELRRFRRLSRSGRMSIAPSSRSASGKLSNFSDTNTAIVSEDLASSSDEEDSPGDLLSDTWSISSASHPSSPTLHAARARFQDPKRVEVDLAAQRALLLDSQKLNTSIERCLANSESLIQSGRRALDYHAPVPEQDRSGARVLTPDEIDGDLLNPGQGLLSPSVDHMGINPWERSLRSLNDDLKTSGDSGRSPLMEKQPPLADAVESLNLIQNSLEQLDIISPLSDESNIGLHEVSSGLAKGGRRVSEIASIDGLDDDSDVLSGEEARNLYVGVNDEKTRSSANGPTSRTTSPVRTEHTNLANPQPGQPGYRGSMQGLGHYLQAFSLFGASQHP